MDKEEDLVTTTEACEILGLKKNSVILAIKRGHLRARRKSLMTSATWLIYRDSLDEYLQQREALSHPDGQGPAP